jgi:hypothetical protein
LFHDTVVPTATARLRSKGGLLRDKLLPCVLAAFQPLSLHELATAASVSAADAEEVRSGTALVE